jgi:O-antigen/teichoic acid export membrane protein
VFGSGKTRRADARPADDPTGEPAQKAATEGIADDVADRIADAAADRIADAAAPASLVTNASWLFASRVISIVAAGALSIFAIRELSVGEWGRYSTIVSLVAVFGTFTEAGISSLTLRETSSRPDRERQILITAQSAVALTGLLSLVLMLVTAAALGYLDRASLVALGGGIIICQAITTPLFAVFNARRLLVYPSLLTIAAVFVSTGVGIALVAAGVGPAGLLTGSLAAQVLAVFGGYRLLLTKLGLRARPHRPTREVLRFIRSAVPIAATSGLAIIYQRLDILMLSKISGDHVVAIYSVPYSLVQMSWVLPQVVGAAYFPLLNEELRVDREQARRSFFLIVRVFLVASLPVVLLLTVGGRPLLVGVFGERYAASSDVLAILAWASLLGFQSYVLWYVILASRLERRVVRMMAAGLIVNAALNAVLIPEFGPEGAAAALVVSDLLVIAAQVRLVHREIFRVPWRALLLWPSVAGAAAAAAVVAMRPLGGIAAAVGASLVYVGALLALRYVTWEEWKPLRSSIAGATRRMRPAAR